MTENMKSFLEEISGDREFIEKLTKAETTEALIALAAEKGFALTAEDLEAQDGELNEDELAAVAGGKDCFCAVGGGGTGGDSDKTCACVVVGEGYLNNGNMRCECYYFGGGSNQEIEY